MELNFTSEQLSDPAIMNSSVEFHACLQCGYCINNCPTYQLRGGERDSPRGRILLIKEMLEEGGRPNKHTVEDLDRCLYCMACMAACPSRVNYMQLLDHGRTYIEENFDRPMPDRLLRWLLARILPYPRRFRFTIHLAQLIRPLASAMPKTVDSLIDFVPRNLPSPSQRDKSRTFPVKCDRRLRVALMQGCVQRTLNPNINDSTIRILQRHGCEVVMASDTGCCGALTHHMGKSNDSRAAAAKNIRAWMEEVNGEGLDAIVINISGCGTMVKDYHRIFQGDEKAQDAITVSRLAKDISEVLSSLDLEFKEKIDLSVAYHSTCSLQYGQRIRFVPKKLLRAAGFSVLEPRDSSTCCGFAGTYKLTQPDLSGQLMKRKVETLTKGNPDVIAAGNIGCMMQIASGTEIPVVHTVELLDWATGGPMPDAITGLPGERRGDLALVDSQQSG